MKPIKSYDPRKSAVVAALKRASNCRKVTNVRENGPDRYVGDCMWPNSGDAFPGTVQVVLSHADMKAAP
jgi:hypothetical protein